MVKEQSRPVIIHCRPHQAGKMAEMLQQIHAMNPERITIIEWHPMQRELIEAAESAADWLCEALPDTDQHCRGLRLRRALDGFSKEKSKF